jgi:hypothetical protein
MSWTPPRRPVWVERWIAHGDAVGGAANLVPLDSEELLDNARRSTGLDAFGGDAWREHFEIFVAALESEAQLHLPGRTLVRAEILQTLRNRLQLADLWDRNPALLDAKVEAPVFIVGSPRSGTSILHELMACDPASRTPAMWEMHHPVASFEGRDRSELSDQVTQFWHDLQPEYETMHANSGHLPNECIFITMHEFLSDHWGGVHCVPGYDAHLRDTDQRPAYRYHERFLKTLQANSDSRRWLLKAPSHLFQMRTLFDVYPDARIIRTHRDPLKTLPSAISLMGTLKWMRTNQVDMSQVPAQLAYGYAFIYQQEIEQRESGALPDDRFIDVRFDDIVRDPLKTLETVYTDLGWRFGAETRRRFSEYAAKNAKGARGAHRYQLEEAGFDADHERERFRFYSDRYGVAAAG